MFSWFPDVSGGLSDSVQSFESEWDDGRLFFFLFVGFAGRDDSGYMPVSCSSPGFPLYSEFDGLIPASVD